MERCSEVLFGERREIFLSYSSRQEVYNIPIRYLTSSGGKFERAEWWSYGERYYTEHWWNEVRQ